MRGRLTTTVRRQAGQSGGSRAGSRGRARPLSHTNQGGHVAKRGSPATSPYYDPPTRLHGCQGGYQ